MGILDEDVARVRDATDLVALASEHLALKRVGRNFVGLCPFHTEKSPSFNINPETGRFKCLAGETRVITWDGVKPIRDLVGTTQRVLTTNGRWIDAPFSAFGEQQLVKLTIGRNRVTKSIYATADHRWFVRTQRGSRLERTTMDLKSGDRLAWTFAQRALAKGVRLSPQGVAHGITYGDGSRFKRGSVVDLHGEKNAELLKWFPLNTVHRYDPTNWATRLAQPFVKVMDLPGGFKERPSLDESPAHLVGWLAGLLRSRWMRCQRRNGDAQLGVT